MKLVGIGNAYIFVISGQGGRAGEKGLAALTDEWWDHLAHAVREGTRMGVDTRDSKLPMVPERNADGTTADTVTGLAFWILGFHAGKFQ